MGSVAASAISRRHLVSPTFPSELFPSALSFVTRARGKTVGDALLAGAAQDTTRPDATEFCHLITQSRQIVVTKHGAAPGNRDDFQCSVVELKGQCQAE